MGKIREIKGRMKAVANIRRITKTMQMIATARFQASQRRAMAAQPYTMKISELVSELGGAGSGTVADHPLLRVPDPAKGRDLLLVLTSNRGLCGGYNASILRTAAAFLRQAPDQQVDLEVIGKKGLGYFKFARVPVAQFHDQFTDTPDAQEVESLAARYMTLFTEGQYDTIRVVYMAYYSTSRQSPQVLSLLPMRPPSQSDTKGSTKQEPSRHGADVTYDFLPPPDQLLNELLPIAVKNQLRQCFNEAVVGEHIARMVAMKSATDSAGKMGKDLTRQYNRARQAAITTELSEIIAGSAALQ